MRHLIIPTLLLAAACLAAEADSPDPPAHRVAPPMDGVANAFEAAARLTLPAAAPEQHPDLSNLFVLSPNIISGGEPRSRAALELLAGRGVKTIISVDGKVPDADTAAALGMRYVHIPIQYKAIKPDELLRIAKTFRELEAPFFIHCFQGHHRGPATAAVGRVLLDGISRSQAMAEMRQWMGTSSLYEGLYRTLALAPLPAVHETSAFAYDFPAAHPFDGFRAVMVEAARVWDRLEDLAARDWTVDPAHPDLDPTQEARQLSDLFRAALSVHDVQTHPASLRSWLARTQVEAAALVAHLEGLPAEPAAPAPEVRASMGRLQAACEACHRAHRNG